MHKLNKNIKPINIQIISKFHLETVQADITYFNKYIELNDIKKILIKFCRSF